MQIQGANRAALSRGAIVAAGTGGSETMHTTTPRRRR